jgi:aspartate/tyrosine/aromatic aminotransferase
MAFQGLTTGDISKDAHPVRMLVQERQPIVLCQSFDAVSSGYDGRKLMSLR